MVRKSRIWLFLSLLVIATLFVAACASPSAEGDGSAQIVVDEHEDGDDLEEAEHMDDEHAEGDDHDADEHEDGDDHDEDEHMEGEHADDHEHAEMPHEYEDLENPFTDDAAAIAAGAELFAVNCASCHGDSGLGDGPAAAALDPKPASLADSSMMSDLSDAYVFWRITEGGIEEPFNSAMPPWGESLSEEQRWQLVTFVRSLVQ